MSLSNKLSAEFLGTAWLVLGGCGSAVISAAFPDVGIGLLGVSLAFGLTVLTMAYAIGHISGCHLNPAVTVGLVVGGRRPSSQLLPCVVAQVLGAAAGCTMLAGLVAEAVLTFMFLMIILGATDARAPAGFAPIEIGLGLTLVHLISIPVTNTSVKPARSTGPALFVGGWAIQQRWLFWLAPILGAAAAGFAYRAVSAEK